MIKVYVLDSNIEEICHKGVQQITDEEFKLFGKEHTLEQFEHELNHCIDVYNQNRDHVRFIEEKPKDFIGLVGPVWNNGFTIKFIENSEGISGVGLLLLHPDNMPKNE